MENKQKLVALGAKLKVSAGHIWPAGRMLCIPGLAGTLAISVEGIQNIRESFGAPF